MKYLTQNFFINFNTYVFVLHLRTSAFPTFPFRFSKKTKRFLRISNCVGKKWTPIIPDDAQRPVLALPGLLFRSDTKQLNGRAITGLYQAQNLELSVVQINNNSYPFRIPMDHCVHLLHAMSLLSQPAGHEHLLIGRRWHVPVSVVVPVACRSEARTQDPRDVVGAHGSCYALASRNDEQSRVCQDCRDVRNRRTLLEMKNY